MSIHAAEIFDRGMDALDFQRVVKRFMRDDTTNYNQVHEPRMRE
jgi:hypothetical protein